MRTLVSRPGHYIEMAKSCTIVFNSTHISLNNDKKTPGFSTALSTLCASHQRHIVRDRRPSTADCLAIGTKKLCTVRKKIFCTGPTRAARAEQKSLVPARHAQRTNQGRTPLICTHIVPIHLSFKSQQGPPLSSFSASH
jgi:hypothetical protein